MKICNSCGKEYQDYLQACPVCYSMSFRIKSKQPKQNHYSRICVACGREFDCGNNECPYCGSIETAIMNTSTQQSIDPVDEGSFANGFWLSFAFGFVPAIILLRSSKENTREGVKAALIVRLIFIIIILFIILLVYALNI